MDPQANLEEQLAIAKKLLDANEVYEPIDPADALRLAELVQALHGWRTSGGFDPYSKEARRARPDREDGGVGTH